MTLLSLVFWKDYAMEIIDGKKSLVKIPCRFHKICSKVPLYHSPYYMGHIIWPINHLRLYHILHISIGIYGISYTIYHITIILCFPIFNFSVNLTSSYYTIRVQTEPNYMQFWICQLGSGSVMLNLWANFRLELWDKEIVRYSIIQ